MKRAILLGALLLCTLTLLFADYSQYQWYRPADIGFWMPADTEVEEDDETWYAYSESIDVLVIFEETDTYVKSEDISEASLFTFDEVYELDDFVVIDTMYDSASYAVYDSVSYAYGKGIYTDEEGEESEVIFGILSSPHYPDKTFIFSIMSSDFDNPATAKALKTILSSIIPSPAG